MIGYRNGRTSILCSKVLRAIVVLSLLIAVAVVVLSCSADSRHRIKTVIFTGVPSPAEDQATGEDGQAAPEQSNKERQLERQQRHRDALVSKYWQHGPFAAGECGRCHSLGHSKSFLGNRDVANQSASTANSVSASSRLKMPREQLCVTCHSQHSAASVRKKGLQQHLPAAQGACTTCHSPHQSLRRYMLLLADNRELCSGCHKPTTLTLRHAESSEQDCLSCHNAHVGTTSAMLRADGSELALIYGDGSDE